jgi:predicted nucleic acid-binding protein
MLGHLARLSQPTNSRTGLRRNWQSVPEERAAVSPTLLDSSFLIDLEREIESGQAGPAISWLRRNRAYRDRALLVPCVTVAEFLEGFEDIERGLKFITCYVPQSIGFKQARKCAELQRRANRAGRRYGENDAWQLAFAECAGAAIVARDRKAFAHLGNRYERFDAA